MYLTKISLEHVRKFAGRLVIDGLDPGFNLIHGPNEEGKSTIAMAVKYALFLKHQSSGALSRRLYRRSMEAPPKIGIDFYHHNRLYELSKSFGKEGVRLSAGDSVWSGDEAEQRLRELWQFDQTNRKPGDHALKVLGVSGLFWIEQGQSTAAFDPAERASTVLTRLLRSEAEKMASDDQAVLIEQELKRIREDYWTPGGRAKKGRFKQSEERLEQLSAQLSKLKAREAQYLSVIKQFSAVNVELEELVKDDLEQSLEAQLEVLNQKSAQFQQDQEQKKLLKRDLDLLDFKLSSLEQKNHEVQQLERQIKERLAALEQKEHERAFLQKKAAEQEQECNRLSSAYLAVERALKRQKLSQKSQSAKKIQKELLDLSHELTTNLIDDHNFNTLNELVKLAKEISIKLEAGAANLVWRGNKEPVIQVDGDALLSDVPKKFSKRTIITIGDAGSLELEPAGAADLSSQKWELDQKIVSMLSDLDCVDFAEAEQKRIRKSEIERSLSSKSRELEWLLDGLSLDQVTKELNALTEQAGDGIEPQDVMENELPSLKEAASKAQSDHVELEKKLSLESAMLEKARADLEEDRLRFTALQEGRQHDADPKKLEDIRSELGRKKLALVELESRLGNSVFAGIEDKRNGVAQQMARFASERNRLSRVRRDLEIEIKTLQGQGLLADLENMKEQYEFEQGHYEQLEREARAVQLLTDAFETARKELKDQLQPPLQDRIRPYLQKLFPDADLVINPGTLSVDQIMREDLEDLEELSYGTREQIAVLLRLGLADLLIDHHGESPPLILDDTLVFADEVRFARMKEILKQASSRMQIILLTCRPSDYHDLQAKNFDLEQLSRG